MYQSRLEVVRGASVWLSTSLYWFINQFTALEVIKRCQSLVLFCFFHDFHSKMYSYQQHHLPGFGIGRNMILLWQCDIHYRNRENIPHQYCLHASKEKYGSPSDVHNIMVLLKQAYNKDILLDYQLLHTWLELQCLPLSTHICIIKL